MGYGTAIGTGIGTAVGGPAGGFVGGGVGSFVDSLFGGGSSQSTAQPFDFPIIKPFPASNEAKSDMIFGVQGNYNPNALLPSGQTSGGFQFNPFPGGFQQFATGQQQPQQQGQPISMQGMSSVGPSMYNPQMNQQPPQNLQQAISQGGSAQQQFVNQQLYNQLPINQAPGAQSMTPGGQQSITNIQNMYADYQQAIANGNTKKAQNIQNQIQQEINKLGPYGTGILQGKDPYMDQANMQSAGYGNLGLGFQNIQNAQQAAGGLVSQGTNVVNQGIDRFNTQAGNLQNTIGQNTDQFQNYFSGLQGQNQAATDYNNQAAGYSSYSPETISRAYGLQDIAGGLASSAFGDKDLARNILTGDISQRTGLINQGLNTGIDATTQGIADQVRNSTLNSFMSRLTSGDLADQLQNRFLTGQSNAAARGLGVGSSPVLQAGIEVEKERDRLLNDATNQANIAANHTVLNVRQQQQAAAMQGAGLLNQSAMNSLGQFAPLISAGASAVYAGNGALNAATNAQTSGANILSQSAQNAINQGQLGVQQGNLLLSGQNQQQSSLQNLINSALQGDNQAAQNLNALAGQSINAGQLGVQQGNLGLQTQGQGFDQLMAIFQALEQQRNNKQNVAITNAATNAGAQVG